MKRTDRTNLIVWDVMLIIGYTLAFALPIPDSYRIIIGFLSAIVLSTTVRNHIAAYKLSGKLY